MIGRTVGKLMIGGKSVGSGPSGRLVEMAIGGRVGMMIGGGKLGMLTSDGCPVTIGLRGVTVRVRSLCTIGTQTLLTSRPKTSCIRTDIDLLIECVDLYTRFTRSDSHTRGIGTYTGLQ